MRDVPLNVRELGAYIREQRRTSQISLRQLSRLAGVSNPYLSQIERGLRRPSAEILQQIAKALRISAEALYVQAGILEQRPSDSEVPAAVLADITINERQKQVLLEIYDSFRRENDPQTPPPPVRIPDPEPRSTQDADPDRTETDRPAVRPGRSRRPSRAKAAGTAEPSAAAGEHRP